MDGQINLWDDNPTVTDLLGIDTVVEAIITAITSTALDPVTVSIQSPWGGGKSSALNMIERHFGDRQDVLVLRADPWEYEDVDDIRGTLIGEILSGLQTKAPSLAGEVGKLLKRISWTRVANTVVKSALTMSIDPEKLVDAFTLKPEEPKTMAGFREQFQGLMNESTEIAKVVVLVDDLDRCRPATVMATLEAIKVFLSVPKMSFVLAAEEEMIRWAIAQDTHAGGRSEFADRYLEKIVQLPVALPRLTPDTAETYVTLLLSEKRAADNRDGFIGLVEHVAARRRAREVPYLGGTFATGVHPPHADDVRMAALIAKGLYADKWNSPRAIKRFLNAWGVRESIAASRGLGITADVSLKLYILEQRFPTDFERLVAVPDADRAKFIADWEKWGRGEDGARKPDDVSESTAAWAASEPSLVTVAGQFDHYVNLAASFTSLSAGSGLSDEDLVTLANLSHESEVERKEAVGKVLAAEQNVQATILEKLLVRLPSFEHRDQAIVSACEIAAPNPALHERFAAGIRAYGLSNLDMSDAMEIAHAFPSGDGIAEEIAKDGDVDEMIRSAIADALANRV